MKITILDTIPGEEDEIIIKCQNLSEDIQNLLQKLKQGNTKIAGYNENGIHLLEPERPRNSCLNTESALSGWRT